MVNGLELPAAAGAVWIWIRVHCTPYHAVLWRSGDDMCLSRAVVDDFGQLVLLP